MDKQVLPYDVETSFGCIRRRAIVIFTALFLLIFTSAAGASSEIFYPSTSFAVISDLHVYDTSLGTDGAAFSHYLDSDRKLLVESREILHTAVDRIIQTNAEFVLVSGDLTKDGEKSGHEICRDELYRLIRAGKKVYVVPGNHDVLNGESFRYDGDMTVRVPNIKPEDFTNLYYDFGYSDAVLRDTDSLSYVAEPVEGLWIVAMDACLYDENPKEGPHIVNGKFREETLRWIDGVLSMAREEGKAVIGIMHFGIVEHYAGQQKYYGEYLVDDWPDIAQRFARNGMNIVFTGHYHAQDIAMIQFDGADSSGGKAFIADIETGSMVSFPNPYRLIEISDGHVMKITSKTIDSIPSHTVDFVEYSRKYLYDGIESIAVDKLRKYWVPETNAKILAPQIAKAIEAHYSGDEIVPEVLIDTSGTNFWTRIIVRFQKGLIDGLWHDGTPPDNNITIDLETGTFKP